jgi:OmpA-OmpF porin, OOP family
MRILKLLAIILAVVLMRAGPLAAETPSKILKAMSEDAPDAADHEFTGRYEGSFIVGQTVKAFDELTLPDGAALGKEFSSDKKFSSVITVSGRVTRTMYLAPEGRSSLEIFANYKDKLTEKGFVPVFECAKEACGASFKILKYKWSNKETMLVSEKADDQRKFLSQAIFDKVIDPRYLLMKIGEAEATTYAAVFAAQNQGGSFGDSSKAIRNRVSVLVEVVEPDVLEKKMVTISAGEIDSAIGADGKIVLYGVLFDFDKATIKPESKPQLEEMARYLKENETAKVYIVGHTDNVGKLDYNLKLSAARAEAVVNSLAEGGVDAQRMVSNGVGPFVPIASNRTEEGQILNRRVELVEQ